MRILLVTSVRNEGPYLLEWIAHHKAAGVTDFLIYSNDCDDGTDLMLNALEASGIITHVPQQKVAKKSIQWQAFTAAWKHPLRKKADWILVADVDEFLNIHIEGHDLTTLLDAVPSETDGIVIPWRLYGHNGVMGIEDSPVTEQFTRAIDADTNYPIAAGMFKTLFKANGPFNQLGIHRPRQKPEARAGLPFFVDGAGAPLPHLFASNTKRLSLFDISKGRSLVEMNHYAVRSAAAFLLKRDRGLPNRAHKPVDLTYWVERNFNTVENHSISAMAPATRRVLDKLLKIKGLSDLRLSALLWHRNRFATLVRDPDTHRLLVHILTAGGSSVLPEQLQRQLVSWYQQALRTQR